MGTIGWARRPAVGVSYDKSGRRIIFGVGVPLVGPWRAEDDPDIPVAGFFVIGCVRIDLKHILSRIPPDRYY